MSQPDSSHGEQALRKETSKRQEQTQFQPVFGFIAVPNPVVLENIIAAQNKGYPVVGANPSEEETVTAKVARELAADIFTPAGEELSVDELSQQLWARANAKFDQPVIIVQESTTPIDVEASIMAYETDTAVPKRATDEINILVGIPAYNEAGTIGDVVSEAEEYADQVLVVDDASTDTTAQEAKVAGATVVSHNENQGYVVTFKTVFEGADVRNANHLVILDVEGQYNPSDVPQAVRTQEKTDADIIIGSRFVDESETDLQLYRWFDLAVVNTLTNLSMGVVRRKLWVNDTQSGFRTYNQQAIESLSDDDSIAEGMSSSTDILYHAHKNGYESEEIGTKIDYDVEDPSRHNPVSHSLTLVSNIVKTIERERPMVSLGVPGFMSAFVGLGFGYWTFSNFINTGTFPVGLALISAVFALAGIFTCFTAIILHSLNTHLDD